jgi:serine/threonine protein kinase
VLAHNHHELVRPCCFWRILTPMVGPPSQPGPSVPSPGDVLRGKYRIERILGRGGMGVVALAHHLRLDHPVAIKVLRPNPTEPHAAERFAREARAAARLHGEHVVRILDVDDSESGLPFIVMEYLEGTDLEKIVKERGGLPVAEAVEYVLQACEGVAEAHAAGIVHRDLKPSNLFLVHRPDGSPCVKLVDFGISKPLEATDEMALTDTEWVVGSPMYMAPEQLRSAKDVDLRADVWALGLVLYRLLTGRHAFEAESRPAVILRIAAEAPTPIASLRPDVPPALGEIILRCLAKDRNARFARVEELAAALEPFAPPRVRPVRRVSGTSSAALPVPPPSSSGIDAAGSAAAADEATTMSASASTTGAHVSHVSHVSRVDARRRGPWLVVGGGVAAGAIVAAVAAGVWRAVVDRTERAGARGAHRPGRLGRRRRCGDAARPRRADSGPPAVGVRRAQRLGSSPRLGGDGELRRPARGTRFSSPRRRGAQAQPEHAFELRIEGSARHRPQMTARRHRLGLVASLLAASTAIVTPAAAARPAPVSHALSPRARTLYEEGRALYAKGDYAGALDRFGRAHDITPDPRLLWNMAACEHKLGHYVKMLRLVRDYLETGGNLLTDEDRREASKLLATVRAQVASLAVTTDPPGADVFIDDQPSGTTPLGDPILVNPGEHEVRLRKPGYQDLVRTESFASGQQLSWSLTLQPVPAAPPPKPAPPPPPPEAQGSSPSHLPLIVGGAGLVVAAAGGTLVVLSASRYSSLQSGCAPSCDPSRWRTWQTLEPLGWVLVGVGGAAAIGGLVWQLSRPHGSTRSNEEASLYVGPAPNGAVLGGRF